MGRLLKQADRALELDAEFAAALEKAQHSAVKNAARTLIYQANGFSPGDGTLANEIISRAGGINLTGLDSGQFGTFVSLEHLIDGRPEVILLSDYANATPALAHTLMHHPVLKKATQLRNVQTRVISERAWTCGNQHIPEVITQLARTFKDHASGKAKQ